MYEPSFRPTETPIRTTRAQARARVPHYSLRAGITHSALAGLALAVGALAWSADALPVELNSRPPFSTVMAEGYRNERDLLLDSLRYNDASHGLYPLLYGRIADTAASRRRLGELERAVAHEEASAENQLYVARQRSRRALAPYFALSAALLFGLAALARRRLEQDELLAGSGL